MPVEDSTTAEEDDDEEEEAGTSQSGEETNAQGMTSSSEEDGAPVVCQVEAGDGPEQHGGRQNARAARRQGMAMVSAALRRAIENRAMPAGTGGVVAEERAEGRPAGRRNDAEEPSLPVAVDRRRTTEREDATKGRGVASGSGACRSPHAHPERCGKCGVATPGDGDGKWCETCGGWYCHRQLHWGHRARCSDAAAHNCCGRPKPSRPAEDGRPSRKRPRDTETARPGYPRVEQNPLDRKW